MARVKAIKHLKSEGYERNTLHTDSCMWVEKNCYIDVWIEVLHALGLEVRAILPFTAFIDFEGDQWTFFKPPHEEIRELYGIDVSELYVWRPLIEHAIEHLDAGKLISTEADAYWLPDTSGTDYQRKHTKSTIVLNEVDLEQSRLGYFHNAGYYSLEKKDFDKTFRLSEPPDETFLPLFAEVLRVDRLVQHPPATLVELSSDLWRRHLGQRPESNPVRSFQQRFEKDLPCIQEHGLDYYHAWAFGTIRQLGAASELASRNLQWLATSGMEELEDAALSFETLSVLNKTFILKGARAATRAGREFDGKSIFDAMAQAWQNAMDVLDAKFGA